MKSPPDGLAAARDLDIRRKSVDALDELGGRPGVKSLAVDDQELAEKRAGNVRRRRAIVLWIGAVHLPASTLLATVMYFRPASRASSTA